MRAWWLAVVALVGCVAELPTSGCRETELFCEGACVDAQRSRAHCGGCGRSCEGLCVDSTCVPCPACRDTRWLGFSRAASLMDIVTVRGAPRS